MTARDWIQLTRLSNAPTVIGNVLVGIAVGLRGLEALGAADLRREIRIAAPFVVAIGVVLLYCAGMIFNDVFDLAIDRRERPSRPLPSGRIAPRRAINTATVLLIAGIAMVSVTRLGALPWGLLLGAAILAYDIFHRSAWLGIPLISLCRMVAIIIGAVAIAPDGFPEWPILWWFVGPLGVTIAIISIVARREMDPAAQARRRWLSFLLPITSLLPLGALLTHQLPLLPTTRLYFLAFLVGAQGAWQIRAAFFTGPAAIMRWLAGLALTDSMSLLILDQPGLALVSLGCFFVTSVSHRRVAGS